MDKYLRHIDSRIHTKSIDIVKKQGFFYFIKKGFYKYLFGRVIRGKEERTFRFQGKKYEYFYHEYNSTWINERVVEVPIIKQLIKKNRKKRILEIGNVLSHYYPASWDIVDKYESAGNVDNRDVVDLRPEKKYDLIISISTFEHIGFDEIPADSKKIKKVIENIKRNCLNKGGELWITAPAGYNHTMDRNFFNNIFGFQEKYYLKRINWKNQWVQVEIDEVKSLKYNSPYIGANGLIVAFLKK